jgi:GT2 family glycosyltransferase
MSAIVIPSLGASCLDACLSAVGVLDPAPERVVVVLSGTAPPHSAASTVELVHSRRRLGFAAAVNIGLRLVLDGHHSAAILNDDAVPSPQWLGRLTAALEHDSGLGAVQGTVDKQGGTLVDGRGIALDRWLLPVQIDRNHPSGDEASTPRPLLAVSGTAALFRCHALRSASLAGGDLLDRSFGSYHEDLDLGLRLRRSGWRAAWIPGAPCRHLGSVSGASMRWRHPWWVLANRWRALACNLRPSTMLHAMPRLLRGELRAVRCLARQNPRAPLVSTAVLAALPLILGSGWSRSFAAPRLASLTELQP